MTENTTALATLLTVVAGFLYQFITTARQRRWDLEDRHAARDEVRETATALARKVAVTAGDLALTVAQNHETVTSQIAGNTQLTREAKDAALIAQQEANHANAKLASLGIQAQAAGLALVDTTKEPTP